MILLAPPYDFRQMPLDSPLDFPFGFCWLPHMDFPTLVPEMSRRILADFLLFIWGCQPLDKKVQKKLSESSWGGPSAPEQKNKKTHEGTTSGRRLRPTAPISAPCCFRIRFSIGNLRRTQHEARRQEKEDKTKKKKKKEEKQRQKRRSGFL